MVIIIQGALFNLFSDGSHAGDDDDDNDDDGGGNHQHTSSPEQRPEVPAEEDEWEDIEETEEIGGDEWDDAQVPLKPQIPMIWRIFCHLSIRFLR